MSYILSNKTKKLTPYQPIEGDYPVRLDANESFLLPTGEDIKKMTAAAEQVPFNRYPDPLATKVCAAFADLYGIEPQWVTAGNGSDELISVIMSAFLEKGEKVLTLSPDFSMYQFYSSLTETPCITLDKREDMAVDVDAILQTATQQNIRLIIFSNPCNPTSLGISAAKVRRLIRGTSALVVLDEAYMDFWDQSLIKEAHEYDNLILLRTCSKALGMAAVRLGFAVANERLTGILRAAKSPYNVNAFTQAMAQVALENPLYRTVYTEILLESRDMLWKGLGEFQKKGLVRQVFDSRTNFVFVRLPHAHALFDRLCECGMVVRCFGNEYLRITAGTQRENQEVLAAMQYYLTEGLG